MNDRERTNHDAAPAARADLPDERPPHAVSASGGTPSAASRDGSGTGDTRESLSGSLPADLGDGVSPSENDKNLHHTQDSFATYERFAGSVMEWIDAATDVFQEDKDGSAIVSAWYRCRDAYDRIVFPTTHDAAPEATARTDADRVRTDNAASRPGAGTGDTSAGALIFPAPENGPNKESRTPVITSGEEKAMTDKKTNAEPSGASGGSHGVECCEPDASQERCVQCGATVFTCERKHADRHGDFRCPAHPDGLEVDDGVWACGEKCFEEYEDLRLERLAEKVRNSRLYGE